MRTRARIILFPIAALVVVLSVMLTAPYRGVSAKLSDSRSHLDHIGTVQTLGRLFADQAIHLATYPGATEEERRGLRAEIAATDAVTAETTTAALGVFETHPEVQETVSRAVADHLAARSASQSVLELVDSGRLDEAQDTLREQFSPSGPSESLRNIARAERREISASLVELSGATGLVDLADLKRRLRVADHAASQSSLATEVDGLFVSEVKHLALVAATGDDDHEAAAIRLAGTLDESFAAMADLATVEGAHDEEREQIETLRQLHLELIGAGERVRELARGGDRATAAAVVAKEVYPLLDGRIREEVSQLRDHELEKVRKQLAAAKTTALATEIWIAAVLGTVVLVVLIALRYVSRRIVTPVFALREAAIGVASGDLESQVAVKSLDELGELGREFNDMVAQLRAAREALVSAAVVENSSDVLVIIEADGSIRYVNAAASAVLGRRPAQLRGSRFDDLVHEDDRRALAALLDDVAVGTTSGVELRLRASTGGWVDTEVKVSDLRHDHHVNGIVVTIRDITERKQTELALAHQAFHDSLTGLPNRALALDRLAHALAGGRRPLGTMGVLFCDLDNFKVVNDSVGHEAGDDLLVAVAQRLRDNVRSQDSACRFGGDEFAVLVPGPVDSRYVAGVARRIVEAFAEPFAVYGREFFVSISIGFTIGRSGESVPDQLLREADIALHRAKIEGKARFQAYDESMLEGILERVELEAELRRALDDRLLEVHYQPKFDSRSMVIVGVEALVRWPHPTRGMVPPGDFIAVAEETGQIGRIGEFVLETACSQVRQWRDAYGVDMTVAVNISVCQLRQTGLADTVEVILARTGLPASALVLEVTESALGEDAAGASATLEELSRKGVAISIDDFGTSYSSLSRLRDFPVDELKIDKSFVQEIVQADRDFPLVTAMISMAQALGHRVVAEGVEIEEQVAFLQSRGCDHLQGFLLSRPLAPADVAQVLERSLVT